MNRVLIITFVLIQVLMISSCIEDEDLGDMKDAENTDDSDVGCPESNKFCHSHDGLDWSDASSNKMDWDDAITYCENLGGRLPTISELRTLIQNCPATETGGECGVTDNCLSSDCWTDPCGGCEDDKSGKYSVFGDRDWFWSSSELSGSTDNAWLVSFRYGYVLLSYKDYYFYVRCAQ